MSSIHAGYSVKLRSFNGLLKPKKEVESTENYWILIGAHGVIKQSPLEDSLYASFSKSKRVLVKFEEDLCSMGLEAHNEIENSLWILVSDLETCGESD